MTYFLYALGGAVVGFLLAGWYLHQLLLLRRHIGETREIIEKNEAETAVLQRRLSEFEEKFPDEPRSMWS